MSKTKTIAKKAKARAAAQEPPAATAANDDTVTDDEIRKAREYVGQLLQGKVKLSNEIALDLVGQLRNAEQALAQLVPQIDQMQQQLENANQRRTALTAVSQNIGLNLYRWRKKTGPKKES